jgi:hypothetical protein
MEHGKEEETRPTWEELERRVREAEQKAQTEALAYAGRRIVQEENEHQRTGFQAGYQAGRYDALPAHCSCFTCSVRGQRALTEALADFERTLSLPKPDEIPSAGVIAYHFVATGEVKEEERVTVKPSTSAEPEEACPLREDGHAWTRCQISFCRDCGKRCTHKEADEEDGSTYCPTCREYTDDEAPNPLPQAITSPTDSGNPLGLPGR